jgi:hypothetical protein
VPVEIRSTVVRHEPHLPYGDEVRELMVVPALAVNVSPRTAIMPAAAAAKTVDVRVELVNNVANGGGGRLALRLPSGWASSPAAVDFTFARAGERTSYTFKVSASSLSDREYRIEAVATLAGREYVQGYDVIEHRDLETRYFYHPATTMVRGVDVAIAPNLKVGYVMGIGDDVPAGIAQLGASVTLLGEPELATGNLRQFDAIVTGTRAYAVRDDLKTYTPMISTHDKGQEPQRGGWLTAEYGKGHYTYFAYAFHRQLPFGVPGAYRLLANLLSLRK